MGEVQDPTVDMFRNMPRETIQFFRVLMGVGTVTSIGSLLYTLPAVYRTWWESRFGFLHECMYYWLGATCAIQIIQISLRCKLAGRLAVDTGRVPRDRLVAQMMELLQSLEWRINKYAGSVAYWFFIIGSCLTSYERTWADLEMDTPAREFMATVMVALIANAARLAFSFCWFFYNFVYGNDMPHILGRNGRAADNEMLAQHLSVFAWPAPTAAPTATLTMTPDADVTTLVTAEVVTSNTSETAVPASSQSPTCTHTDTISIGHAACCSHTASAPFNTVAVAPIATATPTSPTTPTTTSNTIALTSTCPSPSASSSVTPNCPTSCAICLEDFEVDQEVARLPCSTMHIFHKACVVPWLRVQKKCPLCTLDIDEPREGDKAVGAEGGKAKTD